MWREVIFLLSVLCFSSLGWGGPPELFITGRSHIATANLLKWWVIPHRWDPTVAEMAMEEILFTGTLVPGSVINQWNSGYGKVLVQSIWRSCLYMTNMGTLSGNPTVCWLPQFEPL
jgi:hypothetical protein